MPRGTDTRERILAAAQRLVLEQGFGSTTVDAVLEATGTSKGAFFHHFATKADLGRALVRRYAQADADLLDAAITEAEATTDDPAAQVVELIRVFERETEGILDNQPSCLFVSFIYENEFTDDQTGAVVREAIELWRRRILHKLEQAVAATPSAPAVDLASLADHVFVTLEGAFLLGRATGDAGALPSQLAHVRHYVELLLGRTVAAPS